MFSHRSVLVVASLCCSVAALASCGGKTGRDDAPNPGASGGKSGSAATGSSTGVGGSNGGSATGGNVSTGGSLGLAGGAGTGPTPDFCSLSADSGDCDASVEKYFFNPATGNCELFFYGGCGGNLNQFSTYQECDATCANSAFTACTSNDECALVPASCCGVCEPSDLEDYVAINNQRFDDWVRTLSCGDVNCEPCGKPDRVTATSGYLVATCDQGTCTGVNLRTVGAATCQISQDCKLRNGSGCCAQCTEFESNVIALSDESVLTSLVCNQSDPEVCPACEPLPPDGYEVICMYGMCQLKAPTP